MHLNRNYANHDLRPAGARVLRPSGEQHAVTRTSGGTIPQETLLFCQGKTSTVRWFSRHIVIYWYCKQFNVVISLTCLIKYGNCDYITMLWLYYRCYPSFPREIYYEIIEKVADYMNVVTYEINILLEYLENSSILRTRLENVKKIVVSIMFCP